MQFQCDGGGEFINTVFLQHLASHGIRQLVSCPHTPQQNGLVERKHKHITELGVPMMFHSKVPQQFWVKAFFTVNFLGNLLPSSVLSENKSPYEVLYGKKPIYSSLRTFGCKCFPYMRPYMNNNMDPKSLACVFIGYNKKYKGYCCYYTPTGRVFISRHILFDESVYSFEDMYNQYHKPSESALLNAWRSSNLRKQDSPVSSDHIEKVIPPQRSNVIHIGTIPLVIPSPRTDINAQHQDAHGSSSQKTESDSSSTDSNQEANQEMMPQQQPAHSMITKARAGIVKPNPRYVLFTV